MEVVFIVEVDLTPFDQIEPGKCAIKQNINNPNFT